MPIIAKRPFVCSAFGVKGPTSLAGSAPLRRGTKEATVKTSADTRMGTVALENCMSKTQMQQVCQSIPYSQGVESLCCQQGRKNIFFQLSNCEIHSAERQECHGRALHLVGVIKCIDSISLQDCIDSIHRGLH